MKHSIRSSPAMILVLLGLLLPVAAYAQAFQGDMRQLVTIISGPFLNGAQCSGPGCLTVAGLLLMNAFKPIIGVIATLIIVRAGFVLVYRGSDEELARAKRSIASSLTAIILFFLSPRMVDMFYGGIQTGDAGGALENPSAHAFILSTEIYGFLRWITVLVGVGAVTIIIISGLRCIASLGSDDGTAQLKRTVGGVIGGIFILLFAKAIMQMFGLEGGAPTPYPLLVRIIEVINGLLTFIGLLAFAVVVYAGFTMVLFLGNEEKMTSAKNLIVRALVGIAVILTSYVLMAFVMSVLQG